MKTGQRFQRLLTGGGCFHTQQAAVSLSENIFDSVNNWTCPRFFLHFILEFKT